MSILNQEKFNLLRNRVIFSALILVGVLSLIMAFKPEPARIKAQIQYLPTPTPFISPSPKATPIASILKRAILNLATKVQASPDPTYISAASPTPNPSVSQSEQKADSKKLQVNILINNNTEFSVLLEPGSNQCDVLSKALEQGKISSLNMRYDDNLKTYAIYQINGLGKENSVWWVYEVNGQSPSQGCSYIKASEGDQIKWRYIGS